MENKWGTCCGVWGDIIVGLGYFLDKIGEGKILYLGNNDEIVEFLKCQPFITQVKKIDLQNEFDWKKYWINTVFNITPPGDPNFKSYPEEPFLKAGYNKNDFKITHLTFEDALPSSPIFQWHGVNLPKHVNEWAYEKAKTLPKDFYLVQPYSFNSNGFQDHWDYWDSLLAKIHSRTNKRVVTIGTNWPNKLDIYSPNILGGKSISLYNEIPSMMHVFALARYAKAVITTSNSLAHWCQIDNIPCLVINNRKSTRSWYIFRRVLNWPTIKCVEFNDSVETAYNILNQEIFSLDDKF